MKKLILITLTLISLNLYAGYTNVRQQALTAAKDVVTATGTMDIEDILNPVTAEGSGTFTISDLDSTKDSVTATGTVDIENILNTVTVQATDFDIRDLSVLQDSIIAQASGTYTVEATDLDIRDLQYPTDSIAATVTANALDIRQLSASDIVTVDDITNGIDVDVVASGSIDVNNILGGTIDTVSVVASGTIDINSVYNTVTASLTGYSPVINYDDHSGSPGLTILGADYKNGNSGIDSSSESFIYIPYEHHKVHDGSSYVFRQSLSLANTETASYVLTTPDTTEEQHVVFVVDTLLGVSVDIYENATATPGATYSVLNRNRRSANTNNMTVQDINGVSVNGTQIFDVTLGADKKLGGQTETREEVILKRNTQYYVLITSNADSNIVNFDVSWYEHTPKN